MNFKTLLLAAAASMAMTTAAHAVTYVLAPTNNANGNEVAAQADITASGDKVTIVLTNLTEDMFASNQALSDLLLTFTTDVDDPSNFTQDGQRANVDGDGNVTNIAGDPTRWDISKTGARLIYLNAIGGGQPDEMIASNDIGDPNGGFANFNPYLMGNGTFTFDLAGASNLRLAGVNFSFGTSHEFKADGTCITRCGGTINPTGVVPEPASWALMIMGFGGAGAMLRRRRAALANVPTS